MTAPEDQARRELHDAARWMVDVDRTSTRPTLAWRIAMRRLEIAVDQYDEGQQPDAAARRRDRAIGYGCLAAGVVVGLLMLYGFARIFGLAE